MTDIKPPLKSLSPQEWETLIDDFQYGGSRLHKWTSQYTITPGSLLDLVLSSVLKRDFPLNLKLQLLLFIDEFISFLVPSDSVLSQPFLDRLVETLGVLVHSPTSDGLHITFSLKEQMMVSTTSILISIDAFHNFDIRLIESLVEILLTLVNRPNYGIDRQARAVGCECLRELEKTYPCLLSDVGGHLWSLCQSERTHVSQSYILLFTTVVHNIVAQRLNVSILNTTVPLVPFNVPQSLLSTNSSSSRELSSGLNAKELRRAMAFLLEWPRVLTPCGMMIFMEMIMPVAEALELQASMLKVQFFGMMYSFDPMLCHVVLMMYLNFLHVFDEQDGEFCRMILLISKEAQHYLVFRLLALHWLLGFSELILGKCREVGKMKNPIVEMALSFYPTVFDPLAVKALKLDLLAFCSICTETFKSESVLGEDAGAKKSVVDLFQDGLISVSAFKWLPPGSTETAVAFRAFHKFLIGASSHSDSDSSTTGLLMKSTIFLRVQGMLVELMLEYQKLVPVVVAYTDRLLGCQKHHLLGESLLHKFDEILLPKVVMDYKLISCFPVFDRIAENETIPPRGLLELLTKFMLFLVEKHDPDTGLKSWSQGSKVLGICRTMLMHHQSSRLFLKLSHLLAFTSLYFPDLEVRDNARTYLRMLICIPGKKLRNMLNLGDQLIGISPPPHYGTPFDEQPLRPSHDLNKYRNISSYVHLDRNIPLLVKQSWSLSLSNLGVGNYIPRYLEGVNNSEPPSEERESDVNVEIHNTPEAKKFNWVGEPLRVIDSRTSEILGILQRHFSCIPDFRHMPGLKVRILCCLKFESEPFNGIWGKSSNPAGGMDDMDDLPAMYATVLKFSSSAPYGPIPSCHIPFLLGEPPTKDDNFNQIVSLDVPLPTGGEEHFKAQVAIEFEPREPTPGLVDVSIESNAENGKIIHGQLQSITVGIEDLFQKPIIPLDVPEGAKPDYCSNLFNALWEACGSSSNTGRETFQLKGGKGVLAVSGTQSVKLLEVSAYSLIQATERYLAPFVVSVIGESLVNIVKDGGTIRDVIWKDAALDSALEVTTALSPDHDIDRGPLHLTYLEDDKGESERSSLMEVCDFSTLVRIRTDHWPCLAYIDEYLEALFLS